MSRRFWLAAAAALLFSGGWVTAQEKPSEPAAATPDQQRIAELIKQLDSEKADQREAANAELRKIGEPALPALEKTLADPPSIEVKFRAQAAIDGIKLDLARRQALKIDDILAQAKAAQAKDWDKKKLDALLQRLIEVLAAESGRKELALPKAGDGGLVRRPFAQGGIVKDKRVKVAHCHGSIVLAETVADISHAHDSVIIAGGVACVGHSTNCVIISGQIIDVAHAMNSVLLCNSHTEVSHAHGSVLAGGAKLEVSHAHGTIFLNAPAPMAIGAPIPGRAENKSLAIQGIIFGQKKYPNPLDGKLTLTLAMEREQPLALFKLKDGTGEYVARYEQEIKTPQGQPIEELKGWTLVYAGDGLAVFLKDDEIACVRQEM